MRYLSIGVTVTLARKVAEVLKEIVFFTGTQQADVLLRKDKRAGTVVSFVVNKTSPDVVSAFEQIATYVAERPIGQPLTLRLIDDKLNTQKESRIK